MFDKTVLQKGTGLYCPNKLGEVVVDVTGKWTASDEDFIFDRQDNRSIVLDEADNELSESIADMICTMKQWERAQFVLHGGSDLLKHAPTLEKLKRPPMRGGNVVYTLRLCSFERGKDLWELTDQERLKIAKQHKEAGSKLFKANQIRQAAMRYSKSVQYLAPVDPDMSLEVEELEEHEKEMASLKTVSLLNLAACQLKLELYDYVVQNCSKALEVEPKNVKGWYRKAKALLAMKDYESARSDLLKAKELDPSNQAVNDLLKELDTQESAHRAKYKDALKVMFN